MDNCSSVSPIESSILHLDLILDFHSIPHIIFFGRRPNRFQANHDYLETLSIWACLPILFIVCLLSLTFVSFCRCYYRKYYSLPKCSKIKSLLWLVFLLVVCLVIAGGSEWPEYKWRYGSYDQFTGAVDDINNLTSDLQLHFDDYDWAALSNNLSQLKGVIPTNEEAYKSVQALIQSNQQLNATFDHISPKGMLVSLQPALSTTTVVMDIRQLVGFYYPIGTAGVLLLLAICLCCSAKSTHLACAVTMLVIVSLFTILTWALAGVSLAYLMVSSDICSDPHNVVKNFTLKAAKQSASSTVVDYYLVCNEQCVPSPFREVHANTSAIFNNVATQEETVRSYVSSNKPSLLPVTEDVEMLFETAESAAEILYRLGNCTRLNTDYLSLLQSFCNDGFFYSFILFSAVSGLAVILFVVILGGAYFAARIHNLQNFQTFHLRKVRPKGSSLLSRARGTFKKLRCCVTRTRPRPASARTPLLPGGGSSFRKFKNPLSRLRRTATTAKPSTVRTTGFSVNQKVELATSPPAAAMDINNLPQCEYFRLCRRYLRSINSLDLVKNTIFISDFDKCFCFDCAAARGDAEANQAGNPPETFGVPWGYAKFGVRLPHQTEHQNVFNEWHVCYHGTKPSDVYNILTCGRLLKPGDKNPDGTLRVPGAGRWTEQTAPTGHNVKQYFFSPSPIYSELYAGLQDFYDEVTHERYTARIVLQIRIKPGTYQVGPSTIAAHLRPQIGPIDAHIPDNVLEWMTDFECVHYIYGVLIKLETDEW